MALKKRVSAFSSLSTRWSFREYELSYDFEAVEIRKDVGYDDDVCWDEFDYPAAARLAHSVVELKRKDVRFVVPQINRWANQGNVINKPTLLFVLSRLMEPGRLKHAIQVADWMVKKQPVAVDLRDRIRRIELRARCGMSHQARRLFLQIPERERYAEAYNAMLLAYVKDNCPTSARRVFDKMLEKGLVTSSYPFSLMASIYRRRNNEKKLLQLVQEAKQFGIKPSVCFNSILQGIGEAENIFHRIRTKEERKHITTYVAMADRFISEGLLDKAEEALREVEQGIKVGQFPRHRSSYCLLASTYASLRNTEAVIRCWKLLLKCGPLRSRDYSCLLKAFGKLGEVQQAERLFEESVEAGVGSLSICNAMLQVYTTMGMTTSAEAFVRRIKGQFGFLLDSWSHLHLVELYSLQGDFEKARLALKQCQRTEAVEIVLDALSGLGDVDRAEELFGDWREIAGHKPRTSSYNKLLKVYLRAAKLVNSEEFVQRMLEDKLWPDAETENMLADLQQLDSQGILRKCGETVTSYSRSCSHRNP